MAEAIQQRIAALEKRIGREGRSPLFAQLANYYLETDRAKEALRICDVGLSHFPFYTTGHLIKGKALVALNMQAEARREFEFVLDFLPKNETVATLLQHLSPKEEDTLTQKPEISQPKIFSPQVSTQPTGTDHTFTIPSPIQSNIGPEMTGGFIESDRITQEPLQTSTSIDAPLSGASFFEAITQETPINKVEDPFALGMQVPTIEQPATEEASPFGDFTPETPQVPPAPEILTPPEEHFKELEYTQSVPEASIPVPAAPEMETFEHYAARQRIELSGEDTISLDDYFNNVTSILSQIDFPPVTQPVSIPSPVVMKPPEIIETPSEIELPVEEPQKTESPESVLSMDLPDTSPPVAAPYISIDIPSSKVEEPVSNPPIDLPQPPQPFIPPTPGNEPDEIEELANKLQTAKRITPVIDITPVINIVEKETPPPSQQDSPPIGFVTPTLAEIYAKQGWFDDAIKAYRTLVRIKPGEKERFEKRIGELEELKKQSGK